MTTVQAHLQPHLYGVVAQHVLRVMASQLGNLALEVSGDLELSSTLGVEGMDSLIRNQQLCAIYLR